MSTDTNYFPQHAQKTFESNVRHLAQQRYSKLRRLCTLKPIATTSHMFKVVSPRSGAMTAKTGKRPATPYEDTVMANRVAIPAPYGTADSYEWDDVVQQSTDPGSTLTTTMAAQAGRQWDDLIIAAVFGTAYDAAGSGNTFPVGQVIGGSTTAFDEALVRLVNRKFLDNEIDPEEPKFFVISPAIAEKVLGIDEAVSADYTNGRPLENGGFVKYWMGFNWIVSGRLAVPAGTQRACIALTAKALGLVIPKDTFVEIGKDPSASFSTTVYTGLEGGCVRVQDEQIFKVHVDEAL